MHSKIQYRIGFSQDQKLPPDAVLQHKWAKLKLIGETRQFQSISRYRTLKICRNMVAAAHTENRQLEISGRGGISPCSGYNLAGDEDQSYDADDEDQVLPSKQCCLRLACCILDYWKGLVWWVSTPKGLLPMDNLNPSLILSLQSTPVWTASSCRPLSDTIPNDQCILLQTLKPPPVCAKTKATVLLVPEHELSISSQLIGPFDSKVVNTSSFPRFRKTIVDFTIFLWNSVLVATFFNNAISVEILGILGMWFLIIWISWKCRT